VADKKKYYELDEIGFVGTQDKRTNARVKKDIEETVRYIKVSKSRKRAKTLTKTK
jgi:hypothetical protein